jgi:hypothetical protein
VIVVVVMVGRRIGKSECAVMRATYGATTMSLGVEGRDGW